MAKSNIQALFLSLLMLSAAAALDVDVTKHGAKQNADISQALRDAWKEACAATTPSKVLIPQGTYQLSPVTMEGPCKAAIELQVKGTLKALTDPANVKDAGSWVSFNKIEHLTVSGGGTFDGQGAVAPSECEKDDYCKKRPINLSFNAITNSVVQDVTSLNSKQFHINVIGAKNFTFQRVTVTAPEESLNTDGIHVGRSSGVTITDSKIGTGDDCISIGDGTQQMEINKIDCGPGHGISVGSLGKYQNEQPVVGIRVRECNISNTSNGVRIKTWPASYPGTASDLHFEDIKMNNVSNPILLDQVYCPHNQCNAKVPSRVKLDRVSFKNIRGTSATAVAIKLACSGGVPCEGVELADISLTYTGPEGPIKSECTNIQPKTSGKMNPPPCIASAAPSGSAIPGRRRLSFNF
ncbi:hypothetical protein AB3S75_006428 [Citrus x aurantiifolia]